MVMASRDRSAKANRDLRWTTESCAQGEASGFGQLLPFNYSGKRPFERPLYFGSGQMANSHTSAKTDAQHLSWQ